jgi:uncharacterized protein DUF262
MKALSDMLSTSIADEQPDPAEATELGPLYRYDVVNAGDAIAKAAAGEWDLPNFQRRFMWTPWQVCNLADSLWSGYPIGPILLWRGSGDDSPVGEGDCRWRVVDGHHRLTSLCLLAGREPQWLRGEGHELNSLFQHYDVQFDPTAAAPPRFRIIGRAERSGDVSHLIPVRELFSLGRCDDGDHRRFDEISARATASKRSRDVDRATVQRRVARALMMKKRPLLTVQFNCERDDVVEIVQRLASGGMKFRKLLLKLLFEALDAAAGRKHAVLPPR